MAQKYDYCYTILEKKIVEICGGGVAIENAICGLLAYMPNDKIYELYNKR